MDRRGLLKGTCVVGTFFVTQILPVHGTPPPRPVLLESLEVGPDRVLLVAAGGALYISRDEGVSWAPFRSPFTWSTTGAGEPETITAEMTPGPTDADVLGWWVPAPGPSTFDRSARKHYSCIGDVVYVSEAGGLRWTRAGVLPPRVGAIRSSCRSLYASSGSLLYAGTSYGMYMSRDAGMTWSLLSDGVLGRPSVDSIIGDESGSLYANGMLTGTQAGKASYKGVNGGKRWRVIDWSEWDPLDPELPGLVGLVDGKLYASLRRGLFASTDGARTWARSGNGIRQQSQQEGVPYDVVTAVKGGPRGVYALTPRQLYKLDAVTGVWSALGKKGIPGR